MTNIYAATSDQVLVATVLPKLSTGNVNTVRLWVEFDNTWNNVKARRAVFWTSESSKPYEVILSGEGYCTVPSEVLIEGGKLYIAVKGENSSTGATKSSTKLTVKVERGAPVVIMSDPTPGVYQQLLTACAKIDTLAKLQEGSTTGDAELALIRVGADSETYENAGEAVRAQITKTFRAMATDLTFEQGTIASANGVNTNNVNNRIRTGFVPVNNFVSASVGEDFILTVFQYDANLGYISTTNWSRAGGTFDRSILDPNSSFLRFAVARSNAGDLTPAVDASFKFVSAMEASAYENGLLRSLITVGVSFESGTINATTGLDNNADTRVRTGFLPPNFEGVSIGAGFYMNMFQYDASYAFLESTDFVATISPSIIREDCQFIRFVVRRIGQDPITPEEDTGFTLYSSATSIDALNKKLDSVQQSGHASKFSGEIVNTAYSTIGLAPINTAEHFKLAAHLGFNSLKGDVRLTADGKLVMCHDAGVTLDANGRITSYDSNNSTAILNASYDYLMGLEHASGYEVLGHYARMCDFDTFIRICKEEGKIAYITLRENGIQTLVAAVMETLTKYNMVSHCIINSYTYETLREVRKYTEIIPVSQVISLGATLNVTTVNNMMKLGNAIVTMFLYPTADPIALWNASAEAIKYASDNDVQIHMAQVGSYADYSEMIKRGVQGFHILKPFLEYRRSDIQFAVTVNKGVATFGNILGSDRLTADVSMDGGNVTIKNIACNGSGYGYDDGLPALWLNYLPLTANVRCSNNPYCTIKAQNGELVLSTSNADGIYYVDINI